MGLTTKDFAKGVDFTAFGEASGADHNDLVELATPLLDSNSDGKGLNLTTHDIALDTPVVPDAQTYPKWRRYHWTRIPFLTATDLTPIIYAWNDDLASDAILLRWKSTIIDLTAVNANIAAATLTANNANTTANAANNAATNAASLANAANNNASAALTTANNAANAATIANAANATAALAQTTANAALTAINAEKLLNSSSGYVKISHREATNTSAGNSVAGANLRKITTIDSDVGGNVVVATPSFTLKAGTWRVGIFVPSYAAGQNKANLVKASDSTILLDGTTVVNSVNTTVHSIIIGIIILANDTALQISHYCINAINGLGKAANIGDGSQEVYTVAEFTKLNS